MAFTYSIERFVGSTDTFRNISALYTGLLAHPVIEILTSTRFTNNDNFSINLLVFPGFLAILLHSLIEN